MINALASDALTQVALLFLVVYAVNLMPAFGPPTWTIVVLFGLNTQLPIALIVPVAALGAALGRYTLAQGFRLWGRRLSPRRRANLEALRTAFERRRRNGIIALALFALSPLPSAQLFAAVGLMGTRILPFTLAFFAGRFVSYSLYAGGARLVQKLTLEDAFYEVLASPAGIALQIAMLAGLALLPHVDWARLLDDRSGRAETGRKREDR